GFEFIRTLKRAIWCHRLAPGDTGRPRNVPAAQSPLLRIIGHVQEFPTVFAWRAHINEGSVRLDMIRYLLPEGTNGEIRAPRRIGARRIIGPFLHQGTSFIDPLLPPTVHDAAVLVSIHLEDPQSVAGPPVVAVPVEHDGMVVADALAAHEFGEGVLINVVAH